MHSFFCPFHLKADGPRISAHSDFQTAPLKLWEEELSEVLQCSYNTTPEKMLLCFPILSAYLLLQPLPTQYSWPTTLE